MRFFRSTVTHEVYKRKACPQFCTFPFISNLSVSRMIKTTLLLFAAVSVALGYPEYIRTDTRIIDGVDAQPDAYPWQVSLQQPYNDAYWHFCGGSLISANYVMTAAHCYKSPTIVTVYAGSIQKFTGGERLSVSSFLEHPQYNPDTIAYDYGIIQLQDTASFGSNIGAIAIPGSQYNSDSQFAGPAITSGWGYTVYEGSNSPNNDMPDTLQVAEVNVLTNAQCRATWGSFYQSSNMMCAGGTGEGTCKGDSGGPMVQTIGGVNTLIAVTSWGSSSCSTNNPGGKAKLSTVRQWILDNTDLES